MLNTESESITGLIVALLHQDGTKLNLKNAIEQCDESSLEGEIKGYVFKKGRKLVFKETSNGKQRRIGESLDRFVQGDFTVINELLQYGEKVIADQKEMSANPLYLQNASFILSDIESCESSKGLRKITADQYKDVIMSKKAMWNIEEIPIKEPGFLGLYHVHNSGNPPSPKDMELSKMVPIPFYVLSVKKDGLDVYILYKGGCTKETIPLRVRAGNKNPDASKVSNYVVTLDNGATLGYGWLEEERDGERTPLDKLKNPPVEGQRVFLRGGYNSPINPESVRNLDDRAYTLVSVHPVITKG